MSDPVIHPQHYTATKYEVWDVLDAWFPTTPLLWQVGKYIARADRKGAPIEDLEKAKAYLQREIDRRKATSNATATKCEKCGLPMRVIETLHSTAGKSIRALVCEHCSGRCAECPNCHSRDTAKYDSHRRRCMACATMFTEVKK